MGESVLQMPISPAPAVREAARQTVKLIVIEGEKNAQGPAQAGIGRVALGLVGRVLSRVAGVASLVLSPTPLNEGEDEWLEADRRYRAIPDFYPDIVEQCPDCEEDDDNCIVGPYNQVRSRCRGGQAHHIVPDFALRYGTRQESVRGEKRIPGMPSFGEGAAICLDGHATVEGSEHSDAQKVDGLIAKLGEYQHAVHPEVPRDTATIGKVATVSALRMAAVKPECERKIAAAVAAAFLPIPPGRLVRSTKTPMPSGDTLDALMNGRNIGDYISTHSR